MDRLPSVALLFVALGVLFVAAALRDDLRQAQRLTPARHTWLRVASIFAAIAIALVALRLLSG